MIGAVNGIHHLRSQVKFEGAGPLLYLGVTAEVFLVAWSLVLILLPSKRLIRVFRPRASNPTRLHRPVR
jgi:hypothetical protein